MLENPRRGRQARHFTTKILDLISCLPKRDFPKIDVGCPWFNWDWIWLQSLPAWTGEVELILQLNVNFGCIWQYNAVYDVAISADEAGIVEYWSGLKNDVQFPKNVNFEYKTDTDLFEFIMVSELSGKFKWHWEKILYVQLTSVKLFSQYHAIYSTHWNAHNVFSKCLQISLLLQAFE